MQALCGFLDLAYDPVFIEHVRPRVGPPASVPVGPPTSVPVSSPPVSVPPGVEAAAATGTCNAFAQGGGNDVGLLKVLYRTATGNAEVTDEAVARVRTAFATWVRDKERNAVVEQAQRLGVPLVSVNDSSDLYTSEQFAHRKFFQKLVHPILGEADYPTVSYKMSASPAKLTTQ